MNVTHPSAEPITVERIVLREIRLPLKHPFRASWGSETERRLLIVEAHAAGEVGYGEVSALSAPFYTEETPDTAWYVLERFLIPLALGRAWHHPEDLAECMRPVRRHFFAKAGLEGALWDLYSRLRGITLADALRRTLPATDGTSSLPPSPPPRRIAAGAVIGLVDDLDALARQARALAGAGYRRLKVKIQPGWDLVPLRHLRETLGDFPLMADANGAYTLDDLPRLKALDDLNLMMIEQPLAADDIVDHARLQQELATPICLDESLCSLEDARKALDLGSCRVVCLKPGRVGGLSEARRIHDLCRSRRIPVWCGGMIESGIGKAHGLALASLPGFTLPGDFSPSDHYWVEDVVEPAITLDSQGYVPLPDKPGIGFKVRTDALQRATVRVQTFESRC